MYNTVGANTQNIDVPHKLCQASGYYYYYYYYYYYCMSHFE